jgi:hypothetical protein
MKYCYITVVIAIILYVAIGVQADVIVPCPNGKTCFKVGFTWSKTGSLNAEGQFMV